MYVMSQTHHISNMMGMENQNHVIQNVLQIQGIKSSSLKRPQHIQRKSSTLKGLFLDKSSLIRRSSYTANLKKRPSLFTEPAMNQNTLSSGKRPSTHHCRNRSRHSSRMPNINKRASRLSSCNVSAAIIKETSSLPTPSDDSFTPSSDDSDDSPICLEDLNAISESPIDITDSDDSSPATTPSSVRSSEGSSSSSTTTSNSSSTTKRRPSIKLRRPSKRKTRKQSSKSTKSTDSKDEKQKFTPVKKQVEDSKRKSKKVSKKKERSKSKVKDQKRSLSVARSKRSTSRSTDLSQNNSGRTKKKNRSKSVVRSTTRTSKSVPTPPPPPASPPSPSKKPAPISKPPIPRVLRKKPKSDSSSSESSTPTSTSDSTTTPASPTRIKPRKPRTKQAPPLEFDPDAARRRRRDKYEAEQKAKEILRKQIYALNRLHRMIEHHKRMVLKKSSLENDADINTV